MLYDTINIVYENVVSLRNTKYLAELRAEKQGKRSRADTSQVEPGPSEHQNPQSSKSGHKMLYQIAN